MKKLFFIVEGAPEAGKLGGSDVDWNGRRLTFDETGACIRIQTRRGEAVEGAEHLRQLLQYVGVRYTAGSFLSVWDIRVHLEEGSFKPTTLDPAPLQLVVRLGTTPLVFPGRVLEAHLDEEVGRVTLHDLPSSPAQALESEGSRQSGERCAVAAGGESTQESPCKAG